MIQIDLKDELKKIIEKTENIRNTYFVKYPNTKYSVDDIIDEIIYVLKSGVSWNMLRSKINPKTLFWHYKKLVDNNVFKKLLDKVKKQYKKYYCETDILIDSRSIYNVSINQIK